MNIPQLIIDLAIMLSMAGLTSIVFKKLNIPSILGYILVGFLIGPHFPLFLEIESKGSVETWSEIGIIVILFHIGLEFDFHKLVDIGSTAIVSALIKMSGVMVVGYFLGSIMGLTPINCLFLGAMLSISSTVVIKKCFDEMGLSSEKYSHLVMGSLIIEDIISVFMMIVLTTISVGQSGSDFSGIALHLLLMICYLVIWLLLGIFIIPSFLDKVMEYMSDETVTVLSLGFCFLMSLLASKLGFSMELGAFLAGTFFAGTKYVQRIERNTAGIKDVFGAVFFLSVGTMVDPQIIATEWLSILIISLVAVVAKLIFATIGMILSGQNLETSIHGGFSLAPIGEFSFIIASLGISLGVMDAYLYPVIVASAILTIIATPILIRKSDKMVAFINEHIPNRIKVMLDNYTKNVQAEEKQDPEWKIVLLDFAKKVGIYGSIMLVTAIASYKVLSPALGNIVGANVGKILSLIIAYLVIIVFLRPFMDTRNMAFTHLWMNKFTNRSPLMVLVMTKIAIVIIIAAIPLKMLYNIRGIYVLMAIIIGIIVAYKLDFVSSYYLKLEAKFLSNLNQKTVQSKEGDQRNVWLDEDYSIFSWFVPEGAPYAGRSIKDLSWGKISNVYVVKIRRDGNNVAMPSAKTVLKTGDKVYVIGDEQSLRIFHKTLDIGELENLRTLKAFLDAGYPDSNHTLACLALKVRGTEHFAGKTIKHSGITAKTHCMILGIERGAYRATMPDANMIIEKDDILWIVGTSDNLNIMAAHSSEA
ncbi:MAG: cation:proton antiporter [Clostridia bacterium]|nr:cation:proton antiporter [Clostridia bacterium]